MVRNLLATTAIAALLTTGAMAQDATQPAPAAPAATAPAGDAPAAVQPASGYLATNLIGETVYDSTGDQAQNIGEVNDLILTESGSIEAVVVGVGGFLGIGQKNVALDFKEITWAEGNGDRWIVLPTTKEALEGLPDFDRRPYEPAAPVTAMDNTGMAPADQTAAAPATDAPATTTDQTAAAPATDAPAATTDQTATAPATDAPAATTDQTATAPATDAPAASTDTMNTAAIDRSKLTPFDTASVRSEDIVGTTVYGANDANIGEIGDVVMSQDGKVDAILLDVGGFLGMGEKEVAVGMDNLSFMTDADGNKYLYTNMTKEQLEAQPAYDEATWADQRDSQRMTIQ